jgi:hypothetical protein
MRALALLIKLSDLLGVRVSAALVERRLVVSHFRPAVGAADPALLRAGLVRVGNLVWSNQAERSAIAPC